MLLFLNKEAKTSPPIFFTQIRQYLNTDLSAAISTTFYLSASGQTITQVSLHCSFYVSPVADTQK